MTIEYEFANLSVFTTVSWVFNGDEMKAFKYVTRFAGCIILLRMCLFCIMVHFW